MVFFYLGVCCGLDYASKLVYSIFICAELSGVAYQIIEICCGFWLLWFTQGNRKFGDVK